MSEDDSEYGFSDSEDTLSADEFNPQWRQRTKCIKDKRHSREESPRDSLENPPLKKPKQEPKIEMDLASEVLLLPSIKEEEAEKQPDSNNCNNETITEVPEKRAAFSPSIPTSSRPSRPKPNGFINQNGDVDVPSLLRPSISKKIPLQFAHCSMAEQEAFKEKMLQRASQMGTYRSPTNPLLNSQEDNDIGIDDDEDDEQEGVGNPEKKRKRNKFPSKPLTTQKEQRQPMSPPLHPPVSPHPPQPPPHQLNLKIHSNNNVNGGSPPLTTTATTIPAHLLPPQQLSQVHLPQQRPQQHTPPPLQLPNGIVPPPPPPGSNQLLRAQGNPWQQKSGSLPITLPSFTTTTATTINKNNTSTSYTPPSMHPDLHQQQRQVQQQLHQRSPVVSPRSLPLPSPQQKRHFPNLRPPSQVAHSQSFQPSPSLLPPPLPLPSQNNNNNNNSSTEMIVATIDKVLRAASEQSVLHHQLAVATDNLTRQLQQLKGALHGLVTGVAGGLSSTGPIPPPPPRYGGLPGSIPVQPQVHMQRQLQQQQQQLPMSPIGGTSSPLVGDGSGLGKNNNDNNNDNSGDIASLQSVKDASIGPLLDFLLSR